MATESGSRPRIVLVVGFPHKRIQTQKVRLLPTTNFEFVGQIDLGNCVFAGSPLTHSVLLGLRAGYQLVAFTVAVARHLKNVWQLPGVKSALKHEPGGVHMLVDVGSHQALERLVWVLAEARREQ